MEQVEHSKSVAFDHLKRLLFSLHRPVFKQRHRPHQMRTESCQVSVILQAKEQQGVLTNTPMRAPMPEDAPVIRAVFPLTEKRSEVIRRAGSYSATEQRQGQQRQLIQGVPLLYDPV